MSDYIKREDAMCAVYGMHIGGEAGVKTAGRNTYGADLREVIDEINAIPAADVVEVVRCKDCKHCSIDYYPDGNEPLYVCLLEDRGTDKDFYCANGERVSEDDRD